MEVQARTQTERALKAERIQQQKESLAAIAASGLTSLLRPAPAPTEPPSKRAKKTSREDIAPKRKRTSR